VSIWSAIALSLVATCCYQLGAVMQKLGADRMPRIEFRLGQPDVVRAFLHSPIWLGGITVTTGGWVLFLKAIANAPVSIVQPVLGFGLCLLALLSVVLLKERLRPLEWCGIALVIGGIVLLGLSAAREAGRTTAISPGALLVVSLAMVALLACAVRLARAGLGIPLPLVLGCATGVLIGLGALYAKALFMSLDAKSPEVAWLVFLPLTLIANVSGLWIQQAGFQHGRALIVVAMNAVTNKVVTIVGGMATLGEILPAEAGLALARVAGFAAVLIGTAVLARFGSVEIAADRPASP
jgi:drug/metabolite transporter (DMT)-like permease